MFEVVRVITALYSDGSFDSVHQPRMTVQETECSTCCSGFNRGALIAVAKTGKHVAITTDSYLKSAKIIGNGHVPVVVILLI